MALLLAYRKEIVMTTLPSRQNAASPVPPPRPGDASPITRYPCSRTGCPGSVPEGSHFGTCSAVCGVLVRSFDRLTEILTDPDLPDRSREYHTGRWHALVEVDAAYSVFVQLAEDRHRVSASAR